MKKVLFNRHFIVSLVFISFPFLVYAQDNSALNAFRGSNEVSAFRRYKEIKNISIKVPTVVEAYFDDEGFIERYNFAIKDMTTGLFEPYYYSRKVLKSDTLLNISTNPYQFPQPMVDNNLSTFLQFSLPENGQGFVVINLSSKSPITSSAISLVLDSHVAMPDYVEVLANTDGKQNIVLAKTKLNNGFVYFPKTTSNQWTVSYWYSQPLRISEFKLLETDNLKGTLDSVRFLAQPGHNYRIYFDPDRSVYVPVSESPSLSSAKDVRVLPNSVSIDNQDYVIADYDNDGVPDISDNCVSSANADQLDINNNNRGDVCDDFDQDGVTNENDNCSDKPNRDQMDTDSDGKGDVCDGVESRLTEKYPWIPWLGIGFAVLVLLSLFIITAKSKQNGQDLPSN